MTHHGLCWIGLILALVIGSYASCPQGKCGRDCTSSCIGTCAYDCHKDNCSCRNCQDGMYGENCTLNCSSNCFSGGSHKLCNRMTGACSDGCVNGYCSIENRCNTPCGENCTACEAYSCKCSGCKVGHYGDFCECDHCPETVKKLHFQKACPQGKCGRDCTSSCIGTCAYDCHKDNCSCRNCQDGMYGEDCTLHCSSNCFSGGSHKLCNRMTGACSDGCVNGYCLTENCCNTPCGKNCRDCEAYSCKCSGCKAGHYGDFCECDHCPETVKTCFIPAMVILILAIILVMIFGVVLACKHYSKKRPTNKDLDSSLRPQQIDLCLESIDAYPLTGIHGSDRYILTQLPNTRELAQQFLRMVSENDIKVIVFTSSNGSRKLEHFLIVLRSRPGCEAVQTTHDHYELWTLTLSQNGLMKTTYLYHHNKWFDETSFCKFVKDARKNPQYLTKPIVVCSSEGEGPNLVYCVLDCLMDKNPSGGFEKDLNECVKRHARERIQLVKNKKNMQRLRKCCEHVLQCDNEMPLDVKTNVKQAFCRTFRASPVICRIGSIVLPTLFITIIVSAIILIYKCYA